MKSAFEGLAQYAEQMKATNPSSPFSQWSVVCDVEVHKPTLSFTLESEPYQRQIIKSDFWYSEGGNNAIEKYSQTEINMLRLAHDEAKAMLAKVRAILGVPDGHSIIDHATITMETIARLASEYDDLQQEMLKLQVTSPRQERERIKMFRQIMESDRDFQVWANLGQDQDCTEEEILANDLTFAPMMGVRMGK